MKSFVNNLTGQLARLNSQLDQRTDQRKPPAVDECRELAALRWNAEALLSRLDDWGIRAEADKPRICERA